MLAWLNRRARSFRCAWAGLLWGLSTQAHLRLHLLATVAVLTLALLDGLQAWEWCALWLCLGLVWMAELFNTALEALCDRVTPDFDPLIRRVKDAAAAAVLVTCIAAAAVAVVIFL